MKDLSKKIRDGGVAKFNGSQLGISRSGKGDFPRFNYQNDEEWRWCMDPDNDHIYDPYYKTRKELNERIEQEQKLRQMESRIENIA